MRGPGDYTFAGAYDDDWVNLLFVGRVIPNKRIEDVIRFFHAYKTYFNPRSRLLLVGAHSGFERYLSLLHNFIATIGARDVHLVGHVSNEELVAYYELADVFVCASEHEGFCVPLVESFHMGVPVIAYAATAVPSTMDGAGILYTNKDPLHVAGLINAVVDDHALADQIVAGQYAALDRLEGEGFCRHAAAPRRQRAGRAAARASAGRVRFLGSGRSGRGLRRNQSSTGRRHFMRFRRTGNREPGTGNRKRTAVSRLPAPGSRQASMIVNQWVPAAHKGDAIGDSARRVRGLLREMGHQSDLYAMTIDDDLRGDVIPWTDPAATRGDLTIFHFALVSPMTAAFARLDSGRVLQYHNVTPAHFFAGYDAEIYRLAMLGREDLTQPRRPHRRRARRFRIQPAGAGVARLHQHRRVSDCD